MLAHVDKRILYCVVVDGVTVASYGERLDAESHANSVCAVYYTSLGAADITARERHG